MAYVIGTAGHVDHGKSSLVRALTGIDPDRLAEEKAREMTIDLGFAWLTLPSGEEVGIVDVPGHRDFIENMLAGIGGIDLALLIIAADEGVMPQTREHLAILHLLEVPSGIVVLSKCDLVSDPDWLDLVSLDIAETLSNTVLKNAPIIPVSSRTGFGLGQLVDAIDTALAQRPPRSDRGRARLPVDRVFTISGFGTVVTGTLSDGSLTVGDEIEVVPSRRRARIRGLQSHQHPVSTAKPGSRVAINLSGVTTEEVRRGDVVAAPGILRGTNLVDVLFNHLADVERPLKHNAEVKFFSGAAETTAHVRLLGDRELPPGVQGWLQLRLTDAIALDKGDRFILRYPSPAQTIGGGQVLDAHPAHRWRRFKPEVISRLQTLAEGTPEDLVLNVLEGQLALTSDQVRASTGLTVDEVRRAVEIEEARGNIFRLSSEWLMARTSWSRLADRIQRELAAYHKEYPLRVGMPREALRSRIDVDPKLFNRLMPMAFDQELVIDQGTVVRLPAHQVRLSEKEQAAADRLWDKIQQQPDAQPSYKEAAAIVGEDVLQALIERGDLIHISAEVLLDAATYKRWVEQVNEFLQREGTITVAQARDLFGSSRKYVLALLEHLDAIGVTRRVGDERVLKNPAQ